MPLAVALSGAVNIAGEAAWHRLSSLTIGDFYLIYAAVLLAFFLGAAAGSLIGARLPRLAWAFELAPALFALAGAAAIRMGVLGLDMPAWAGVAAMLPPGFALGAHAPLYAAVMKGRRFGAVSALYQGGGVLGLLIMAWWAGTMLSLSGQLAALGAVQAALALTLAIGLRGRAIAAHGLREMLRGFPGRWEIAAFAVGVAGFWWAMMALSEQVFLTVPVRLSQAVVMIAGVAWFALGGALSALWRRPLWWLTLALPVLAMLALIAAPSVAVALLPQGHVPGFVVASQAVAMVMSLPLLATAIWYARAADRLASVRQGAGELGQAAAGGRIAAAAAFGNAVGCGLALWQGETLAPIVLALPLLAAAWAERGRAGTLLAAACAAPLVAVALWIVPETWWRDYPSRLATRDQDAPTLDAEIVRRGLWWFALDRRQAGDGRITTKYVIDGHQSHTIDYGIEYLTGLIPGRYFDRGAVDRSLVVGIGTGQAAWSLLHLSKRTDLVDISPIIPLSLEKLAAWNGHMLDDARATRYQADGMTFVKRCEAGAYDIVLDTATYPALASAFKLFTVEFVAAAKRCLSARGVYVTYFDHTVAATPAEMDLFLRPLATQFRHVDVHAFPYPVVVAYDLDRAAGLPDLGPELLLDSADRRFLEDRAGTALSWLSADLSENAISRRPLRDYQPGAGIVPGLDDGLLEQQALANYLRDLAGTADESIYDTLSAMAQAGAQP